VPDVSVSILITFFCALCVLVPCVFVCMCACACVCACVRGSFPQPGAPHYDRESDELYRRGLTARGLFGTFDELGFFRTCDAWAEGTAGPAAGLGGGGGEAAGAVAGLGLDPRGSGLTLGVRAWPSGFGIDPRGSGLTLGLWA
jgi:hypothetical protein